MRSAVPDYVNAVVMVPHTMFPLHVEDAMYNDHIHYKSHCNMSHDHRG